MTDVVALDPSVRSPGVALFRDGVLTFAGRVKLAALNAALDPDVSAGARWRAVSSEIQWWVAARDVIAPMLVVYERPQIYRASKSKGDPNDLIGLAAVGAGVVMLYPGARVLTPTPAEWCGQLPKATRGRASASPRARRILSRLTSIELPRAPDQHDALDAVGLGLWALGRLEIRHANSGAVRGP